MAFEIKDEADAYHEDDSGIYSSEIDALVQGHAGDGVVSGCTVSAASGLDVTIAAGEVRIGGVNYTVAGNVVTLTAAHAQDPRYDLIEVGTSGTAVGVAGTQQTFPVYPDISANSVLLHAVRRNANDNTITTGSGEIVDKRVIVRSGGDLTEDLYADGQTVYGGRSDGDVLTFQSNSVDFKDPIRFNSPQELFTNSPTFSSSGSALGIFGRFTSTITMDYANWTAVGGIQFAGTIVWGQTANTLHGSNVFSHTATHKNPTSTAVNGAGALNLHLGFVDIPTFTADDAAFSLFSITSAQFVPTLSIAGTGTFTCTLVTGAVAGLSVGTGATVTTRVGYQANELGGSGTTTSQVGVAVASLAKATNNTSILFGATITASGPTVPSGNWGLYQNGTRTNRLNGPLRLDTSSHLTFMERSSTPTAPVAADRVHVYMKGDKLVIQGYTATDGDSYWYLDTSDATGRATQSLTYSATAP